MDTVNQFSTRRARLIPPTELAELDTEPLSKGEKRHGQEGRLTEPSRQLPLVDPPSVQPFFYDLVSYLDNEPVLGPQVDYAGYRDYER
jgi:hypothetical protein